MGTYIRFTDEELNMANSVNLADFLFSRGERLERSGNQFKWIYSDGYGIHDSIMVKENMWYDHKNQDGGGTIKFLQKHFGMDFKTAVTALIGERNFEFENSQNCRQNPNYNSKIPHYEAEKKQFILPRPNENSRRVFAYLVKERCLDPEIVSCFMKSGKIYEEAEYHNAVFVGYDANNQPCQATKRSTNSFAKEAFKQTIAGSDTHYSFSYFADPKIASERLFVFESPIDMMSFISLHKPNWEKQNFVSLNGLYMSAMVRTLENYPNLQNVILCLDNDEAGQKSTEKFAQYLNNSGVKNVQICLPRNKDFNQDLQEIIRSQNFAVTGQSPQTA